MSSLGKQGTLSITLTGNIVSSTNKEIKICHGTTLSYTASYTGGFYANPTFYFPTAPALTPTSATA